MLVFYLKFLSSLRFKWIANVCLLSREKCDVVGKIKCWLLFVWMNLQLLYIFYCIVVKFYRFLFSLLLAHLPSPCHFWWLSALNFSHSTLFVILSTLHNPPFDHLNHDEQASVEKTKLSIFFLSQLYPHFPLRPTT